MVFRVWLQQSIERVLLCPSQMLADSSPVHFQKAGDRLRARPPWDIVVAHGMSKPQDTVLLRGQRTENRCIMRLGTAFLEDLVRNFNPIKSAK